jgi:peptidyl-prolyl cis-trans isomerase C
MKLLFFVFIVAAAAALAQAPPAAGENPTPETVVATIEGKKMTYGELEHFMQGLPPQTRQAAMRNRKQFIQQFALMERLSELAEKSKLDERSPYKEAIAFNRMNILMQAQINETYNAFPVLREEEQKFYDENKSKYEQVTLKVIYIPFSSHAAGAAVEGQKHLTEEEAKNKAAELVKEIKGGADFVKLVKENSEDATSKAKDGDFGTLSRSDNLPESIRSVVFSLKVGEVSEPARQPNGFYIFRAEAVSSKPYAAVREQIFNELKNAKLKAWMDSTSKSLDIKFEDDNPASGATLPVPGAPLPAK